ncbi:MAG: MFS transporter [Kiritimatiellales bacterium]
MYLNTKHIIAKEDKIPLGRLVAYGMGGLVPVALFNIAGQLMGLVANISLGLSAFWLGVIMIIPRLWDAVSDPLIGHISDNTRTPWGRRRPFILLGGILVAVSFVLMWWIPDAETVKGVFATEASYNWFRLVYILVWMLIFFTACNIFEIPHGALGMEMSGDTHERTRLFTAKSFLGNLFAMGTPWLFFLANLDIFSGPGGNEADGMRWVSMLIAVVLIPLSVWWFFVCKEPGFAAIKAQEKTKFWQSIKVTFKNRTFLILVGIFFILGMGFNFVGLLNYYISIFYLYGGDKTAAGPLLGINGTIWAVTGLLAVFPLNWMDRRIGKRNTLVVAILLMCGAQLSKIVCYNPQLPYLVIIPTIMLSAGMLMFFTLGPSMLGDICDEDELKTGIRSDGSYYSIYWWFFKMGTAFASLVTGSLILLSQFDQMQSTSVDKVAGNLAIARSEVVAWESGMQSYGSESRTQKIREQLDGSLKEVGKLRAHFLERSNEVPESGTHVAALLETLDEIERGINELNAGGLMEPEPLIEQLGRQISTTRRLAEQTPQTLLRLRIIEISLPLVLSIFSLLLTFRYPLSETRVYEIKAELERRKASVLTGQ